MVDMLLLCRQYTRTFLENKSIFKQYCVYTEFDRVTCTSVDEIIFYEKIRKKK